MFTAGRMLPFLLTAACAWGQLTEEDVWRVLRERGMAVDSNAVRCGAAEGMLRAIDPKAVILPRDAAASMMDAKPVEKAEEWSKGLRYLKVGMLGKGAASPIVAQMRSWAKTNSFGLIMDLRGAYGTDLTAVDEIAGLLTPGRKDLYQVRDGSGKVLERHGSKGGSTSWNMPVMLLVGEGTREAGGLLAAVLKGRNGCMVLGTPPVGDPVLRERIPVTNGVSVFMGTRYLAVGDGREPLLRVQPDILVSNPPPTQAGGQGAPDSTGRKPLSEKAKMDRTLMERVAGDEPLRRATDILLGLRALGLHGSPSTNLTHSARP